ncbi:helix-turn-helix domain-containing protein [Bradyrhizobium septentrionale]|uniref:helix-turn-helix domain-containing protein n=1 Tax=Bradyrhizobium septentrionale TaxID=1404411 RepID=UPI00159697D5|nr:helix-turn-helix transcriptional regulator [Bradyrhizobium septentrionale]UGY24980.1 helix-turn-helix domain-containing protein [Bradyrhizobium septentrionale]
MPARKTHPRTVTGIDKIIGNRLRQRRLELHISQSELADKLGVSFQQVQKYEKGVNRVSTGRLQQIATVLESDVSFFMGDLVGSKKPPTVTKLAGFLATKDGVEINEAMLRLDQTHRRAVIALARTVGTAYGVEA